uniref:Uncharacterized protein n=1 Tax=Arundo donax TaxID=35708 RepID=A0A0A9ECY3_ARUDO
MVCLCNSSINSAYSKSFSPIEDIRNWWWFWDMCKVHT